MRRGAAALALCLLILHAAAALPALASREKGEDPPGPKSPAERVAGRWRISLDGLSQEHDPILASLAVEGDLLIGTLTAGRSTVPIRSGRIVGDHFKFSFRHADGAVYRMRGAPGPQGLEGTWRSDRESGRWTATPLKG